MELAPDPRLVDVPLPYPIEVGHLIGLSSSRCGRPAAGQKGEARSLVVREAVSRARSAVGWYCALLDNELKQVRPAVCARRCSAAVQFDCLYASLCAVLGLSRLPEIANRIVGFTKGRRGNLLERPPCNVFLPKLDMLELTTLRTFPTRYFH